MDGKGWKVCSPRLPFLCRIAVQSLHPPRCTETAFGCTESDVTLAGPPPRWVGKPGRPPGRAASRPHRLAHTSLERRTHPTSTGAHRCAPNPHLYSQKERRYWWPSEAHVSAAFGSGWSVELPGAGRRPLVSQAGNPYGPRIKDPCQRGPLI